MVLSRGTPKKAYPQLFVIALSFSLIGTTIAITPWFSYDPINLPKQTVLVSTSFFFLPTLFILRKTLFANRVSKLVVSLFLLFILFQLISMYVNQANIAQQFWGTWGRSNGFLSYFSLSIVFFISYIFAASGQSQRMFRLFLTTSYAVTTYTVIQYLQLDPFDWSLKLPFAFFGNINFMSAFLGLACTLMLSMILFDGLPWSSNLFYVALILINTWLIYETESIQGLAIFAIGAAISCFLYLHKVKGLIYSVPFIGTSAFVGFLMMLGTAGVGPFGALLVQQTVIYRTDYWRAGIAAFKDNVLFGVGLDSFGDYYTQYRDFLAATRTGPQRVVNTSHNVVIDLLANGGIFVGTFFACILAVLLICSCALSLSSGAHSTEVKLLPMFSGWLFFLGVSINQIGVTLWGFVFGGMILGIYTRKSNKAFGERSPISKKRGTQKVSFNAQGQIEVESQTLIRDFNTSRVVSCFIFGSIGLLISIIPARTDSLFLSALKSQDLTKLSEVISMPGSSDVYKNKYLEFLAQKSSARLAYQEARGFVQDNPRNYFAWSIIARAEGLATPAERITALDMMSSLDPYNDSFSSLRSELQEDK